VAQLAEVIEWDGRQLNLVDLPYNTTALNERAVELAVTFDWLLPLDADLWGCWSHESSGWRPCDLEPVDYGPRWANKVWIGEWRN
jgi:hypothetical protein